MLSDKHVIRHRRYLKFTSPDELLHTRLPMLRYLIDTIAKGFQIGGMFKRKDRHKKVPREHCEAEGKLPPRRVDD